MPDMADDQVIGIELDIQTGGNAPGQLTDMAAQSKLFADNLLLAKTNADALWGGVDRILSTVQQMAALQMPTFQAPQAPPSAAPPPGTYPLAQTDWWATGRTTPPDIYRMQVQSPAG